MSERQVTNFCIQCVARQKRIEELECELLGEEASRKGWQKKAEEQVFELGVLREQVRVKSARIEKLETGLTKLTEKWSGYSGTYRHGNASAAFTRCIEDVWELQGK